VTDVNGGGKLHVQLDDEVASFGVSSTFLSADLTEQAGKRLKNPPASVSCPYLPGKVGAKVTCGILHEGRPKAVVVRVTAVDPEENRTSYFFDWKLFAQR